MTTIAMDNANMPIDAKENKLVSDNIENKMVSVKFIGAVDKFKNDKSAELLMQDLKDNKLNPSKYLKTGYTIDIKNKDNTLVINIIKQPNISVDTGTGNDDLSPYFKSKELENEFMNDLVTNTMKDNEYYMKKGTIIKINKKRHKFSIKFRSSMKFEYCNNDTSNFQNSNQIKRFENDYIFNTITNSSYFKNGYTYTSLPTKKENTILIKIIKVDEKQRYELKLKLSNKLNSISRKALKEYNERVKQDKKNSDKASYTKYSKALQTAGSMIPIPSPNEILLDLPQYEKMIQTFTSEEFRKYDKMRNIYNYFMHIKQKYGV